MISLAKHYPHYRALLSLGLPIVVGQVGNIVLGFADTLMVGHHSMQELAAAASSITCLCFSWCSPWALPMESRL